MASFMELMGWGNVVFFPSRSKPLPRAPSPSRSELWAQIIATIAENPKIRSSTFEWICGFSDAEIDKFLEDGIFPADPPDDSGCAA